MNQAQALRLINDVENIISWSYKPNTAEHTTHAVAIINNGPKYALIVNSSADMCATSTTINMPTTKALMKSIETNK